MVVNLSNLGTLFLKILAWVASSASCH